MKELPKTKNDNKPNSREIIIESGKTCTVSGEYEILDKVSTTAYVSKGELMPLYCNKKVKWILISQG